MLARVKIEKFVFLYLVIYTLFDISFFKVGKCRHYFYFNCEARHR